jgi:hypothetical protein
VLDASLRNTMSCAIVWIVARNHSDFVAVCAASYWKTHIFLHFYDECSYPILVLRSVKEEIKIA